MRRVLPFALLLALPLVTSACDTFIEYSVVNESDEWLYTRVTDESCEASVSHIGDTTVQASVPARDTYDYFESMGSFDGKCVEVYATDGGLLLTEPYSYGATYTVRSDAATIRVVKTESELEEQGLFAGLWDEFRHRPVSFIFWGSLIAIIFLGIPIGILAGIVLGIRATIRASRPKPVP